MAIGTATRTTTLTRAARLMPPDATTDRELLGRFAEQDDEAAFAAVVRRHTPMVLGVCKRALHGSADAEDACQAVFVVLARKAGRGAWKESVANWLYATARKVAANARLSATRRTRRENAAAVREAVAPADTMTGPELVGILDEELDKLPPRYREPLVLCYLEGLTRDEAAARLGVSDAALKKQLERGRTKLAAALAGRGCALGVALLLTAATSSATATSPRLLDSILASAGGKPSAAVAALAKGVAVGTWKSKAVLAAVVLVGLTVTTTLLTRGVGADDKPGVKAAPAGVKPAKAAPGDPAKRVTVTGTVVGVDGKPVGGAAVWVREPAGQIVPGKVDAKPAATTDRDGTFAVRAADTESRLRWSSVLVAWKDGHGVAFAAPESDGEDDSVLRVALKLVPDDVPLKGRVLDLQGKPVAGATIRPVALHRPDGGLNEWEKAARRGTRDSVGKFRDFFPQSVGLLNAGVGPIPDTLKTDADGRFTLTGLGRDRLVKLRVTGPGLATEEFDAATRAMATIRTPQDKPDTHFVQRTYHGAAFDLTVAPGQPFVGTVTDKETGKPLPNVSIRPVRGWDLSVQAVTDMDGKYRLDGLKTGEHALLAVPPLDQPYFLREVKAGRPANQQAETVNFELHRGTWVSGTVTDKATGKPVSASVSYRPDGYDPASDAIPGYQPRGLHDLTWYTTDAAGKFRVLATPGKGYVFVRASGRYLTADQVDWQGDVARADPEPFASSAPVEIASNWNAIGMVTVADGKAAKEYAFAVDPAVTVKARVADADGKPVAGALVTGRRNMGPFDVEKQASADVEFLHVNPKRPRSAVVLHPDKHLGAVVPLTADGKDTLAVALKATVTARGRLLSEDGKPLANTTVEVRYSVSKADGWRATELYPLVTTDADGKFAVPNLLADLRYELRWPTPGPKATNGYRAFAVRGGADTDLGDIGKKTGDD